MWISLSAASAAKLLVLYNPLEEKTLFQGLFHENDPQKTFDQAAAFLDHDLTKITELFCVQGPGSFTGLRMSASFMLGLQAALKIPLYGIASYELFAKATAIPLRPAFASKLELQQCQEKDLSFFLLETAEQHSIKKASELSDSQAIYGLKGHAQWPNSQQLIKASIKSSKNKTKLEINYGLVPEYKQAKK